MRWLWANSELDGLRKCHRVRYDLVEVFVYGDGAVRFGGFCRCHSVWACPLCAPAIRAGRAREMATGLRSLLGQGGGCLFSTYTVPHSSGMRLAPLFDAVSSSWHSVQMDRTVRAIRRDLGLQFSRSTEVNIGSNGWHPHLHVGEVCPRPLTRSEVLEYRSACFEVWCRAVVSHGLRAPSDSYGLSMVRADAGMADYVHKVEGLASELFRLDRKVGKTEAPFSLLRRAVGGDEAAASSWSEFERVTKGRRMLGQSRGFKLLCPYDEVTDEALLEVGERQGQMVFYSALTPEMSYVLVRHPSGFEGFCELVGPGTKEAFSSAVQWLMGSAPLWLGDDAAALVGRPKPVRVRDILTPDSIALEMF